MCSVQCAVCRYQFTGEEAPVLLEDMEDIEDTTESDWEEEEDDWDVPPLD